MRGTITYLNRRKGFGFVCSPEGEYIVLYHQALAPGQFQTLAEHQVIEFTCVEGARGPQVSSVKGVSS